MPSWDARREPGYLFFSFFASSRTWNLGVGYDACMYMYNTSTQELFCPFPFVFLGNFFGGLFWGKSIVHIIRYVKLASGK